jgi:hypothetical protein
MAAALVPDALSMEFNPAASPSFNAVAARWPTTCIRPSLPNRYSVCTSKWHPLGDAAEHQPPLLVWEALALHA